MVLGDKKMTFKGLFVDFLTGHVYPIVRFPKQIIETEGLTEHISYIKEEDGD